MTALFYRQQLTKSSFLVFHHSKIIAIDLDDSFEVDLTTEMELTDNVSNYIRGVINQLKIKGFEFDGFNCVFSSNIPVGSGLSSSAALECGFYLE
jgi:galactokinase